MIIKNNKLKRFWPKNEKKRSQDLMPAFHDAGQFYWFKVSDFLKSKNLMNNKVVPMHLNYMEAHDIDYIEDWEIAEFKFEYLKKKN